MLRRRNGADGERKELARLLKATHPDDTVVVTRLDRLARSTRDLLNTLDRLGKDGIGFKNLRETAIDHPGQHRAVRARVDPFAHH